MHLIEVAPDKAKVVPGYEQHTFECSGCHDHVRQLVFIPRAIGPLNSEEMRLSAAWLETLNKGTTPKGDDGRERDRRAHQAHFGPPAPAPSRWQLLINWIKGWFSSR
jgi:hypothetical protein